ncbi:MAG: hypothetical protein O3A46_12205, partial [Candidatus Poribacteria bacterium]|nr:hypothetical protein [Candidatus Poribacteria bacterium]
IYAGGASVGDPSTSTFAIPDGGDTAVYYYGATPTDWASTPPTTATIAAAEWLDSSGAGVDVVHVDRDGSVLISIVARGFNGEDFGADSDSTEAPDVADYEATVVLDIF